MIFRNTLIVIISFIICWSCRNETDQENLYIGSYRIEDQEIPYPYLIQQEKDSVILYNNRGEKLDMVLAKIDHSKKIDSLTIAKRKFLIVNSTSSSFDVFDLNDTIHFRRYNTGEPVPKSVAKFRQVKPFKQLDANQIAKELKNKVWELSIKNEESHTPNKDLEILKKFSFRNDSVSILTQYSYQNKEITQNYETKKYYTFQVGEKSFLSLDAGEENPQPIFQIKHINSSELILVDFSSAKIKELIFKESKINKTNFYDALKNTSSYSNCYDGYQGEYYYGDDVTYTKGNEFILRQVRKDAPLDQGKSGYIIIHYHLNCFSQLGNFGLIQTDSYYQATQFSSVLVQHIFQEVLQLNDWPEMKTKEWSSYKDVHGFLMFKIENGKIIEVCP